MTFVLDTAASIALDGNQRSMWVRLKAAEASNDPPVTHAGVLGQAWRGDPRQARMARAIRSIDVRPLDKALGRAVGELLAATGLADVIDAAVVLLSSDGDEVITSDLDDFERLAFAAGHHVELVRP